MKKIRMLFVALIYFLFIGIVNVYAEGTPNIDSVLTNGKLVLKSIEPASISDINMKGEAFYDAFLTSVDQSIYDEVQDYQYRNCNDNYTSCTIYYHYQEDDEESKIVSIEYVFDSQAKAIIDKYLEKLNEGKKHFIVTDLELVNYWINNSEDTSLINFSEEYKSYFDYKNIIPYIDVRGGGGSGEFTDSNIGIAKFKYDDTLYYIEDGFGAFTRNIIYVPGNTDQEDILETVTKRIEEYISEDNTVSIEEVNTVESYINGYIDNARALDEYALEEYDYNFGYEENAINSINNENGELHFLKDENIAPMYYQISINGDLENLYYFVVIKDSSKIQTPKFKTSDIKSDISISSLDNSIPLDTLIKVKKITSGEEFERIIRILETTNTEIFDLSLFSKSTNDYITELEDGSFEVRIPIAESFKNKNLIVYYIDDEDVKHEYKVTVDKNYAVFNTTHFSVYTLATIESQSETTIPVEAKPIPIETPSIASLESKERKIFGEKQLVGYIGYPKDIVFRIDADNLLFGKLLVNEEVLSTEFYTIEKGSTIITLKKEYIKTLKEGTYDLKATFTDGGEATMSFIISSEEENPKTIDSVNYVFILGGISLIGLIGASLYIKKRFN